MFNLSDIYIFITVGYVQFFLGKILKFGKYGDNVKWTVFKNIIKLAWNILVPIPVLIFLKIENCINCHTDWVSHRTVFRKQRFVISFIFKMV